MRFKINRSDFIIKFTEESFDLYEIKTVKDKDSPRFGEEIEVNIGYFGSLIGLYQKLVKIGLARTYIQSFQDVLNVIQKIEGILDGLLLPSKGSA